MATVVTLQQLSQLAAKQKAYIDAKDTANRNESIERAMNLATSIEAVSRKASANADAIDALDIPVAATQEDIAATLALFDTAAEPEPSPEA